MITGETITDEQIRDLRKTVMAEWNSRGKREAWPEGHAILTATLEALGALTQTDTDHRAHVKHAARARCAAILNERHMLREATK